MKPYAHSAWRPSRREFLGYLSTATASLAMLSACGEDNRLDPTQNKKDLEGQLVISIIGDIDPEVQKSLSDAYRQRQPKAEIIWELPPSSDDYSTWLGTQLAANAVRPDIVSGNGSYTYRNYVNFDQYRKTTNPYTNTPWDQTLDWDFARERNVKGERMMLPTRRVHIMWFYNKDLFAKANVTPPKNWGEFVDVCGKLKAAGITPLAINYLHQFPQWIAEIYFDQYHIDWVETVRAQPGDWNFDPSLDGAFKYDPNEPFIHTNYTYSPQRFLQGVRDGKLRFDTPAIAEIVKNLAAVYPKYATSDSFVIEDTYTPFLQQNVAMIIDGTWTLGQLQQDLKSLSPERLKELEIPEGTVKPFEWGTFENPPMEGSLVKSPVRSIESAAGEYLSIVKKNQNQVNLALDFLMFWTCKVGYQTFLDASAKDPSFSPSGPLAVKDTQDPPAFQNIFDDLKMSGNAESGCNGEWLGWGGGNHQRDTRNMFKEALEGKMSPTDFASKLQAYVTTNFDSIVTQYQLTKDAIDNPARQPGS